jgi:hypothetical protein
LLSLGVGAAFALGCSGEKEEPRKLGPPNVYPTGGGGTGPAGGAGGAAGCVPPDEEASVNTLGLHARIDGAIGHFTRDVSAFYGHSDVTDRYEFTVIAWKERGVCGASSITLWVTSPVEVPGPGVYECRKVGSLEPSPYILVDLAQTDESGCTIELTEADAGTGIVAGTFSGTLGSGEATVEVTEGRFRVVATE